MLKSKSFFPTIKEIPLEIESISHKLMLKAGLIRQLGSGLYTWLPLGLIILKKIENIIRIEMNKIGGQECLMPILQHKDLLSKTNRWEKFGNLLLKIKDRKNKDYCLSPTHEETITHIISKEIRSYKQLPLILYQIQTKFRDEIRPRAGVLRTKEFLMKDAYSFDLTLKDMENTYNNVLNVYLNIFNYLKLKFKIISADNGDMGGEVSQEFHMISDAGEDSIVYNTENTYASNIECAKAIEKININNIIIKKISKINLSHLKKFDDQMKYIKSKYHNIIKIIFIKGNIFPVIGIAIKIDHQININKLEKIKSIYKPIKFIKLNESQKLFGPIGLNDIPIYIDQSIINIKNFFCSANENNMYYKNVNWDINCKFKKSYDVRNIVEGDPSPDGKGILKIVKGIEIAHIFQLKDKYSKIMNANFINDKNKISNIMMGCYGIGISRIIAAYIEQNHDKKGIIWSDEIYPFKLIILPINYNNNFVKKICNKIYFQLIKKNIEVLLDDDNNTPGIKLNNMELIGIPHRLIISNKNLKNNKIEYSNRKKNKIILLDINKVINFIEKMN